MATSNLATETAHGPEPGRGSAAEAGAAGELAALDSRIRAVFARLIDSLGRIREGGQTMGVHLGKLAEASGQGAETSGPPTPLQDRIAQTQALFDSAASIDRSASLNEMERRAEAALENVRQRGKFLWATSSIIESTAASMQLDSFRAYGQELRATAHALMSHAEHVSTKILELSSRDAVLMTSARSAARALGDLRESLSEREKSGAMLERDKTEAGRQLAHVSSEVKADMNEEIVGLIGLIQFSDEMAQRLDHIGQITLVGPGYGKLAGVQLQALADDLEGVARDANTRLDRLNTLTTRAGSNLTDSGFAGAISAAVRFRRGMLEEAMEQSAPVIRASEEADKGRAFLDATLSELETAFGVLEKSYDEVSQASINSMILAARTGDNQKALSTLATAVKEVADHCIVSVQAGREAMEQIKAAIISHSQDVTEAATCLSTALSEARAGLADSERFMAGIDAAQSGGKETVRAMSGAVASVLGDLRPLDQMPQVIRDLGARVDQGQPLEEEALSRLFAIYTMERERSVHASACGLAAPPPAPEPAPQTDGDDLDDIFF